MASNAAIDTGDLVVHEPTGETWVVAYVQGDHLAWCGWPAGEAAVADCTLVKKAPESVRDALLNKLANMQPTDSGRLDARCSYARQRLAAPEPSNG